MTKPFIRIHNVETNEIIDREMTDEEFSVWQTENQIAINQKQEAAAKRAAALAKLAALGLEEDDLKALSL